ncbi:MAG: ATP-binding protein [Bacteroidales bacterium]|nr:ATP-binding protein [Bacteroidales bacterium]
MVPRILEKEIRKYLFQKKAIIIYGARQVGKTTLTEQIIDDLKEKTLILNGDEADVRELLTNVNSGRLKSLIGDCTIVLIDEAQRIPEPGIVLKIIHDNFKRVQLIATGSSSLDLESKISEPMTGRKLEFFLYPFSFEEMVNYHGLLAEQRLIEDRMIYGYYPDIVMNSGNETKLLKSLTSSFLFKDLLALDQIRKPVILEKILKALALQTGNEVSYYEIARLLDIDKGTIEKYMDLLEKAYIIYKLPALSRNVRNEIRKSKKIYFYDTGIRNTIIGNHLSLQSRTDKGALWENFLISERQKFLRNNDVDNTAYFWRTTQQQEIDYIEERSGRLFAYEFKWKPVKSVMASKTFINAYPGSEFQVISHDNFTEFLTSL